MNGPPHCRGLDVPYREPFTSNFSVRMIPTSDSLSAETSLSTVGVWVLDWQFFLEGKTESGLDLLCTISAAHVAKSRACGFAVLCDAQV